MGIQKSGIFGEISGKVGGIVYGKARTRQGKVDAPRSYTVPVNPNTAAQQTQRTKFSEVQQIVRYLTSGIYQIPFNRSVGQLPGFQSLQSILMNVMNDSFQLSAPAQTNLGSLDKLANLSIVAVNGTANIVLGYDATAPLKGEPGDLVSAFAIPITAAKRVSYAPAFPAVEAETRSAGNLTITVSSNLITNDVWLVGAFLKGVTPNAGIFSPCVWTLKTVTAA